MKRKPRPAKQPEFDVRKLPDEALMQFTRKSPEPLLQMIRADTLFDADSINLLLTIGHWCIVEEMNRRQAERQAKAEATVKKKGRT